MCASHLTLMLGEQRKSHYLCQFNREKCRMVFAKPSRLLNTRLSHVGHGGFWFEYDSVVRRCKQLAFSQTILHSIGKHAAVKHRSPITFMDRGENQHGNTNRSDANSELGNYLRGRRQSPEGLFRNQHYEVV